MQGKPMNAIKASKNSVARFDLFRALVAAVSAGWGDELVLEDSRYDRVILLFDPDADGIHCEALMLMFFYRWMRPVLDAGMLHAVRPPQFEIRSSTTSERIHAYSESHFGRLRDQLEANQFEFTAQRYRGLASIDESALRETCIDPASRHTNQLSCDDAEAAMKVFAGTTSVDLSGS